MITVLSPLQSVRRSLALALTLAMPLRTSAQTPTPTDMVVTAALSAVVGALQRDGCGVAVGLRVEGALERPEVLREAAQRALGASCAERVEVLSGASSDGAQEALARDLDAVVTLRVGGQGRRLSLAATLQRWPRDPWRDFLAARGAEGSTEVLREQTVSVERSVVVALGIPTGPAGRWPRGGPGRPRVVPTPFRSVVALAAGDLDGDGLDELVLVGVDRVRVVRLSGAALTVLPEGPRGAASLGVLGWTPVPLRQPLGTASWEPEGRRVRFRTSAQTAPGVVTLSEVGVVVSPEERAELWPAQGLGCVALGPGTTLVRALHPGCQGAPSPWPAGETTAAVPVALELRNALGQGTVVEARADGEGGGVVRVGARSHSLSDIAPPLALEDLDDDGAVEVLTASASAPGGADRLRVFTVRADALEERPALVLPATLDGLAVGDLDGDGLRDVVVAFRDPVRHTTTLWIVP